MSKKVLIFAHEFPPNIGGAGVVAYQNAIALKKLGVKVSVLTKEYKTNITNFALNFIPVRSYRFWPMTYVRACNFDKFDIIILNDPQSIYFAGLYFSKKLLSKCICYIHGSEPELVIEGQTMLKKIVGFRCFYLRAIKYCREIVSVSYFMRDKFILSLNRLYKSNFNYIFGSKTFPVFYAGVEISSFSIPNINYDISIYREKKMKIFFSCGRILEEKGYYEVALQLEKLPKDFSYKWLIAGDGPYKKSLELICDKIGLSDKVKFLGKLDRLQLSEYYKYSDCFILLSKLKESFSLVHLESQLFGTPAIGYNHSGMKECIINGKTGYLLNNSSELYDVIYLEKYNDLSKDDIIENALNFSTNKQMKLFATEYNLI